MASSPRTDPRLMDGYYYNRTAQPENMAYFDYPLMPWDTIFFNHLPPFGLRLSANQAAHIEIWLRIPDFPDQKAELAALIHKWWPCNFQADGYISTAWETVGPGFDGRLAPEVPNITYLFSDPVKTVAELNEHLSGGDVPPYVPAVDEGGNMLRARFTSMGLPMDEDAVLDFALMGPPRFRIYGVGMEKRELMVMLLRGMPLGMVHRRHGGLRVEDEMFPEGVEGGLLGKIDFGLQVRAKLQQQSDHQQYAQQQPDQLQQMYDHPSRQFQYDQLQFAYQQIAQQQIDHPELTKEQYDQQMQLALQLYENDQFVHQLIPHQPIPYQQRYTQGELPHPKEEDLSFGE